MGYLAPLRRKFGVVTLIGACLFTAVWVRSLIASDRITIRLLIQTEKNQDVVYSVYLQTIPNYLLLRKSWEGYGNTPASKWIRHLKIPVWSINESQEAYGVPILSCKADSPFGHFTIVRDESVRSPFHEKEWVVGVSYWSSVIPLALLSAWLLLSNHRLKSRWAAPVPKQEAQDAI